jgi:hypothetical protein
LRRQNESAKQIQLAIGFDKKGIGGKRQVATAPRSPVLPFIWKMPGQTPANY